MCFDFAQLVHFILNFAGNYINETKIFNGLVPDSGCGLQQSLLLNYAATQQTAVKDIKDPHGLCVHVCVWWSRHPVAVTLMHRQALSMTIRRDSCLCVRVCVAGFGGVAAQKQKTMEKS